MSRKTDFRKMTISQRWIEIIQKPLVLFHHIYVPTKCAYRDKIWGKFHFSHMGPHCADMSPLPSVFCAEKKTGFPDMISNQRLNSKQNETILEVSVCKRYKIKVLILPWGP